MYLFFTKAALVTFGGAYAVLAYVTQHLVQQLGWLTAEQSVAGLALAETTPGPLIIVLQFMGFMTGWNQPSPLQPEVAAVIAGLLAAWATFLPSFVFIFLGAPHVERIAHDPRLSGALAAITAAVVGVIATLALLLARAVLFPQGLGAGPSRASGPHLDRASTRCWRAPASSCTGCSRPPRSRDSRSLRDAPPASRIRPGYFVVRSSASIFC